MQVYHIFCSYFLLIRDIDLDYLVLELCFSFNRCLMQTELPFNDSGYAPHIFITNLRCYWLLCTGLSNAGDLIMQLKARPHAHRFWSLRSESLTYLRSTQAGRSCCLPIPKAMSGPPLQWVLQNGQGTLMLAL